MLLWTAWSARIAGVISIILLIWWINEPDLFKTPTPYEGPTYNNQANKTPSSHDQSGAQSYNTVNQYSQYETSESSSPSSLTSTNSGYQPRVSQDDVTEIAKGVYNFAHKEQMVDVTGYTRGDSYVRPHQRTPPGGIDDGEAALLALGVGAAIYAADYADQKYNQWSAQREAAKLREAEEKAREEQAALLAKWEAERAREKAKKKSWWGSEEKDVEENPFSIFEKKPWWKR